jgi:hypothetical protein
MVAITRLDKPSLDTSREPLSLQKVTYDRPGGKVFYHTAYNPYLKQNTTLWSAPDSIAQLNEFIPPGAYATCTTAACTLLHARRAGSACPTSLVSPRLAGKTRMPSGCLPTLHPQCAERATAHLPLSMGQADRKAVQS